MPAKFMLIGSLKNYTDGRKEVTVEAGRSVRDSLAGLGIPPEIVALVLVNETHQTKDYLLRDGDEVKVMAVIGGGKVP